MLFHRPGLLSAPRRLRPCGSGTEEDAPIECRPPLIETADVYATSEAVGCDLAIACAGIVRCLHRHPCAFDIFLRHGQIIWPVLPLVPHSLMFVACCAPIVLVTRPVMKNRFKLLGHSLLPYFCIILQSPFSREGGLARRSSARTLLFLIFLVPSYATRVQSEK